MPTVAHKDGIHFSLSDTIVADSRSATGDINIVSHAHSDHLLKKNAANVVCTALTAALAEARGAGSFDFSAEHEHVELLSSGHIVGSAAAKITAPETGRTYLYTGDVSTRDRCYLSGFEPVDADELIVETTYGVPAYTFPDHDVIEQRIQDWVADNSDVPLFLFGYSLGRAQKLEFMVQDVTDCPIYVHGAVHNMSQVIAELTDVAFDVEPYADNKDRIADENAIVVLPSHLSRKDWVQRLVEKTGGLKAGFSGWAVSDSYRYKGGYDATFPLSDHCDFDELVELVTAVDPEKVYTHHGFDEAFAAYLRQEHGYNARALKDGQLSLADF